MCGGEHVCVHVSVCMGMSSACGFWNLVMCPLRCFCVFPNPVDWPSGRPVSGEVPAYSAIVHRKSVLVYRNSDLSSFTLSPGGEFCRRRGSFLFSNTPTMHCKIPGGGIQDGWRAGQSLVGPLLSDGTVRQGLDTSRQGRGERGGREEWGG